MPLSRPRQSGIEACALCKVPLEAESPGGFQTNLSETDSVQQTDKPLDTPASWHSLIAVHGTKD